MAKDNLFLGTAAGSVGDITFYRRNGQQVARARVRHPKNPQTTSQAVQRNFMAPVSRFLSPMSVVLETAWEGLNRAQSLSKLTGENVKLARRSGWYLPKGEGWYPMPYLVSHGTIAPYPFVRDISDPVRYYYELGRTSMAADAAPGTLPGSIGLWSQALIADGYRAGDQVTIIVAQGDGVGGYYPWFTRFIIDPSSTQMVNDLSEGLIQFYVQDDRKVVVGVDEDLSEGVSIYGAVVIISRFENGVWRRSTQQMIVHSSILEAITSEEQMRRAIASYRAASSAPISDVYLNQGVAAPSGTRYIASFQIPGQAVGESVYLSGIGSRTVAIDAAGNTANVLTLSGVRVSDGQLFSDFVVTTNSFSGGAGIVIVGSDSAGNSTYRPGFITNAQRRGLERVEATNDELSDGFAQNAYRFLIAQGVPASALQFMASLTVKDGQLAAITPNGTELVALDNGCTVRASVEDGRIKVDVASPVNSCSLEPSRTCESVSCGLTPNATLSLVSCVKSPDEDLKSNVRLTFNDLPVSFTSVEYTEGDDGFYFEML